MSTTGLSWACVYQALTMLSYRGQVSIRKRVKRKLDVGALEYALSDAHQAHIIRPHAHAAYDGRE
jgi:hypothetical protein